MLSKICLILVIIGLISLGTFSTLSLYGINIILNETYRDIIRIIYGFSMVGVMTLIPSIFSSNKY